MKLLIRFQIFPWLQKNLWLFQFLRSFMAFPGLQGLATLGIKYDENRSRLLYCNKIWIFIFSYRDIYFLNLMYPRSLLCEGAKIEQHPSWEKKLCETGEKATLGYAEKKRHWEKVPWKKNPVWKKMFPDEKSPEKWSPEKRSPGKKSPWKKEWPENLPVIFQNLYTKLWETCLQEPFFRGLFFRDHFPAGFLSGDFFSEIRHSP